MSTIARRFGLVGRARILLHRLEAHRRRVLEVRRDVPIGVLAQRHAGLRRRVDRLVVHVREVHDVAHGVAFLVPQRAAQHVQADERPEVADVPARVHRQPARVHADRPAVGRDELLFRSGQRVVEAHGRRSAVRRRESSTSTVSRRPSQDRSTWTPLGLRAERQVHVPHAATAPAATRSIAARRRRRRPRRRPPRRSAGQFRVPRGHVRRQRPIGRAPAERAT